MSERPTVRRLPGHRIDYVDGAEAELLHIVSSASDVSSRSDELADRIHDWPTSYHLSRLRSNLLRPFQWRAGVTVLDVGAGTGTMARFLGEQGAHVVALEGNPQRAEVAAARCRGLNSVEIVAGDVARFDPANPFDVVLVVGVLEYVAAESRDDSAAAQFLGRCRSFLARDGVLMLAIENQIGLKYLLGHPEDHIGEPGSGLEGYPGSSVARTFTRKALANLLDDAGLQHQQWLFPFPDYKLPTAVLSPSAYRLEDAVEVIDRLIPTPVQLHDRAADVLSDPRATHRVFIEAGLGPEVANSFLVIAGATERAQKRWLDETAVAWLMGDDRRTRWLRDRIVRCSSSGITVDHLLGAVESTESWLTQLVEASVPFARGPSLEQLALAALGDADTRVLDETLNLWNDFLSTQSMVAETDPPVHPFAPQPGEAALGAELLDVNLDNFIVGSDGATAFIDAEWRPSGPVDRHLVQYRALWHFASRVILSGWPHAWRPETTVGEAAADLAARCGVPVSAELVERWRRAEAALQHLVQGRDEASVLEELSSRHHVASVDVAGVQGLPFTALRRDLLSLTAHTSKLEAVVSETAAETAHRQDVIDNLAAETAHRQDVIDNLAAETAHRQDVIDNLAAETAHRQDVIEQVTTQRDEALAAARALEASLTALRSSRSWRVTAPMRALRRLSGRVFRRVRRPGG